MYVRRNEQTFHYEIIIDIEEITEAAQTTDGWHEFISQLGKLYLEITKER